MDSFDIVATYLQFLAEDAEMTMPVAAIRSLVSLLAVVKPSTSAELIDVLQNASTTLKSSVRNSVSLSAGCDLFLRFVLRNIDNYRDWDACQQNLVKNGRLFADRAREARTKIAEIGQKLVRDHDTILVHGRSRAVMSLLELCAKSLRRFQVYITEARVCEEGPAAAKKLREFGIPVCVIPDCAVAYVIEKVDKVFVGAEGVAESGGVINQIGSCQVAVLASTVGKPVYVMAESHKFVRRFPLGPSDLPAPQYEFSTDPSVKFDLKDSPPIDFTPHRFLTALVTDLGVLTPSAVSEELIKIWFN